MNLQQGGSDTASEIRYGLLTHLLLTGDPHLSLPHEEPGHHAPLTRLKAEYCLVAQKQHRIDETLALTIRSLGATCCVRMDAQPSANERPPLILEMMRSLDRLTRSPPCRAVLDQTPCRTMRAAGHATIDLGDRSGADTEAQAQSFGQEEVRAQGESESVGEGSRDCLQLVADRGVRVLCQRQVFSGTVQSFVDDVLSAPAIGKLA